jgi:hypothetical protein
VLPAFALVSQLLESRLDGTLALFLPPQSMLRLALRPPHPALVPHLGGRRGGGGCFGNGLLHEALQPEALELALELEHPLLFPHKLGLELVRIVAPRDAHERTFKRHGAVANARAGAPRNIRNEQRNVLAHAWPAKNLGKGGARGGVDAEHLGEKIAHTLRVRGADRRVVAAVDLCRETCSDGGEWGAGGGVKWMNVKRYL